MTNGLVVMTPSSIAYSGTSASINADGSVVFSACTSLSLNGVFTSDYDNYMVTMRYTSSSGTQVMGVRLRLAGTDASGTNYTEQYLIASSTTVSAARNTSQTAFRIANHSSDQRQGETMYFFGPYLAQPTAMRSVSTSPNSNATIFDVANTHSLSSSYDGISFLPNAAYTISGLVTVFGFNQ